MVATKKKRGHDWIREESELAGRITMRMEEKGLKPVDLALACGVSVSAVGQWLDGSSENLKLPYLFKLADKLEVEARWLAIRKGPKEKSEVVSVAALRENLQPAIFEAVMRQAVPEYLITPESSPTVQHLRRDVSQRTESGPTAAPTENSADPKKPKHR